MGSFIVSIFCDDIFKIQTSRKMLRFIVNNYCEKLAAYWANIIIGRLLFVLQIVKGDA